jgi:hypothetical protein
MQLHCYEAKLPNLKLKMQLKQLLGSLPLYVVFLACRNLGNYLNGEPDTSRRYLLYVADCNLYLVQITYDRK